MITSRREVLHWRYFTRLDLTGKFGYVRNDAPIIEEAIEAFVQEAENGDTEEQLSTARRGRGRPRRGADKKSVHSVRLGSSLKSVVEQRALAEGISVSEVIRRALVQYLHSALRPGARWLKAWLECRRWN